MRVIAGTSRGKILNAPSGLITRPTSDRVKESIFSALTSRIDFNGLSVLDICAGTGALGIEALSRGAEFCCFIESNRQVADILKKNIHITGWQEHSRVLNMDAIKAIKILAQGGLQFDLLFFDPPYSSELYNSVLELSDTLALLSTDAILIAECSARNLLLESYGRLRRFNQRIYGETAIEMYALEEL